MPSFEVPQRQVLPTSAQVDTSAISSIGRGVSAIGQGVGNVALQLKQSRIKSDLLTFETNVNSAVLQLDEVNRSLIGDYPNGNGFADAFKSRSEEIINAVLEQTPESIKPQARQKLGLLSRQSLLNAAKTESGLKADALTNTIIDQVDVFSNQVSRGADYRTLLGRIDETSEALKLINPGAAAKLKEQATDSLLAAEFQRALDQDGYDSVQARFNSGEFDELSPSIRQNILSRASGKVSADVNKAISNAKQAIRDGHVVPNLSGEIAIAQTLGMTAKEETLRQLQSVGAAAYEFARLPLSEQTKKITDLDRKGFQTGISEEERIKLDAYKVHLSNKASMIKSDPYAYYVSVGEIPSDFAPIDVLPVNGELNHDEIQTALSERRAYQEQIIIKDNVTLPLLTNQEVSSIQAAYKNSSPQFFANYSSQLMHAFGRENLQAVADQVTPKDKDMAGYLALSYDNPDLVTRILRGKDNPVKIPANDKWKEKFAELGYTQAGMTSDVMNSLITNAQYLSSDIKGQSPDIDDDGLMESALKALAPKPIELHNGTFSMQFTDENGQYIDEDSIQSAIRYMTNEDFQALGVSIPSFGNETLDVKDVSRWAQLVPVGTSDFLIQKKGTLDFFRDEFGSPIRLNMQRLATQVQLRRSSVPRTSRGTRR